MLGRVLDWTRTEPADFEHRAGIWSNILFSCSHRERDSFLVSCASFFRASNRSRSMFKGYTHSPRRTSENITPQVSPTASEIDLKSCRALVARNPRGIRTNAI